MKYCINWWLMPFVFGPNIDVKEKDVSTQEKNSIFEQ